MKWVNQCFLGDFPKNNEKKNPQALIENPKIS